MWSVRYDLFWADSAGRTTDRSQLPAVLDATRAFVDDVGVDAACGIRLHVDVFDEGDAAWAQAAGPAAPPRPADLDAALAAGYDSMFVRMPARGDEAYAGITTQAQGWAPGSYSEFPVDASGSQLPGYPGEVDPWAMLQMHEWLHQVVAFYDPALGWPTGDVHGACQHGYVLATGGCSLVDEHYFADMLQGRVAESGGFRGMTAADFAKDGTPRHPVRAALGPPLLTQVGPAARLTFPATGYDGTIDFNVVDAMKNLLSIGGATAGTPAWEWMLPARAGAYTVCWAAPETARFRPQQSCRQLAVRRIIRTVGLPVVRASAGHGAGVYTLRATYTVTLRSVLADDPSRAASPAWSSTFARLVVRRNGSSLVARRIRLAHESGTIRVVVHLPRAARRVSLQLRPIAGGAGSFAASRGRAVELRARRSS